MANRPRIVRDKPFVSLLVVVSAFFAVWLVTALWGPMAAALVVVALAGVALYARKRRLRQAQIPVDTFSFAGVADRMRAKDLAKARVDAQRRADLAGAR
jgi:Flp pilus assembly protein TadB